MAEWTSSSPRPDITSCVEESNEGRSVSRQATVEAGRRGRSVSAEGGAGKMTGARVGDGSGGMHGATVMPHTLSPEQYTYDMRDEPPTFALGISNLKEISLEEDGGAASGRGVDASIEEVYFSTGNPSVQQFEGHLRLCVNTPDSESEVNPGKKSKGNQLCVLAVPRYMSIADFYRFMGDHMENILHVRIVYSDTPERYMALVDLDRDER